MFNKVLKYVLTLLAILTLVSGLGAAWVAKSVGSSAYLAAAVAMVIVAASASLALVLTAIQSGRAAGPSAVSGILLAMLVRMGVPLAAMVVMQVIKSPLLDSGFMGLLTLNYLVALPIETLMSLQFVPKPQNETANPTVTG